MRTLGHTPARSFPSKEQAMQFAERHARAAAPSGMPLKWEDAGHSSVLSTQALATT